MPGPLRSAAATVALAAAPLPLPAWIHGATRDPALAPHAQAQAQTQPHAQAAPATPAKPAAPAHPNARPGWTHGKSRDRVLAAKPPTKPHAVPAHAAGDPGDTITDFKFSPGTTTIHVGDTITWTNNGPSPHTATANNGSFDTGTLAKGASASHTFTQAGTFAYICKIHPFMHGTVVVLAAATTPTTSSPSPATPAAGSTTPTPTARAAAASHRPTLPVTGLAVPEIVTVGLALLALGWLLRRRENSMSWPPGPARGSDE